MQTHESYVFRTPLGAIRMEMPIPAAHVLERARQNANGEIEAFDVLAAADGIAVRLHLVRPDEPFELRYLPEWWAEAWQHADMPANEYHGGETFAAISQVIAHIPPRSRGGRGAGSRGRREKDYLVAEVLHRARTEGKGDRAAVRDVCELAVDKDIPWPWQSDPETGAAENTLRKEVQRHKGKRGKKK